MLKARSPAEQLKYSSIRIEATTKTGATSTGTGFFFNFSEDGEHHVPAIVTNFHVLDGCTKARFLLHGLGPDGTPARDARTWVHIDEPSRHLVRHPDQAVDLCALLIGPMHRLLEAQGKRPFYVALHRDIIPSDSELNQLTTVEDILMIGYPTGIWDEHNNMPIMRRGITATHPALNYQGRSEFMIDAACFPGSSGSPIVLFNTTSWQSADGHPTFGTRIKLLGVLYAGPQFTAVGKIEVVDIPTAMVPVSVLRVPSNLGLVIQARRLLDFEPILRELIALQSGSKERSGASGGFRMAPPGAVDKCPCGSGKPFDDCHGSGE